MPQLRQAKQAFVVNAGGRCPKMLRDYTAVAYGQEDGAKVGGNLPPPNTPSSVFPPEIHTKCLNKLANFVMGTIFI
jgi:hypothetical protein